MLEKDSSLLQLFSISHEHCCTVYRVQTAGCVSVCVCVSRWSTAAAVLMCLAARWFCNRWYTTALLDQHNVLFRWKIYNSFLRQCLPPSGNLLTFDCFWIWIVRALQISIRPGVVKHDRWFAWERFNESGSETDWVAKRAPHPLHLECYLRAPPPSHN